MSIVDYRTDLWENLLNKFNVLTHKSNCANISARLKNNDMFLENAKDLSFTQKSSSFEQKPLENSPAKCVK